MTEPLLYVEGDELYDAMVASIAAAEREVGLEAYIFAADEVGTGVAAALAASARRGVRVRILLDAVGSTGARRLAPELTKNGAELRWFHRWAWDFGRFNRRNHRKLLVVDGRQAYMGGFNIHRESSRRLYGPARWRDAHVLLGGDLAVRAQHLFDAFWRGDRRYAGPPSTGGDELVPNGTPACRHHVHCRYLDLLASARRELLVTTPYFVPDSQTRRALMSAAGRGVDVRLLLPAKSDVPVTRWAAHAVYLPLLRAGVRIFEYRPRVLHAKTAVVDGVRATIGTANLDYRSLFVNYELNLFCERPLLPRALRRHFEADLGEADEILPESWARRPRAHLAAEAVAWGLRRWL